MNNQITELNTYFSCRPEGVLVFSTAQEDSKGYLKVAKISNEREVSYIAHSESIPEALKKKIHFFAENSNFYKGRH